MRVYVEGVCVGRATGYEVEAAAGDKVTLRLTVESDNKSVLLLVEAVIACTCTCDHLEPGTDGSGRGLRVPIEGCPVHGHELVDG